MAQILSGLGDAEYLRGRMISAHRYFDQSIKISREQGLGKTLAANLAMREFVSRWQNIFASVLRDFEEAVSLAQKTGQFRAEIVALSVGWILAELGNVDKGERWLKRRLASARQIGSKSFVGQTLTELGRIAYMRGRGDEVEKLAQEAVDTFRDGGMAFAGAHALGVLALVTRNSERRRSALHVEHPSIYAAKSAYARVPSKNNPPRSATAPRARFLPVQLAPSQSCEPLRVSFPIRLGKLGKID